MGGSATCCPAAREPPQTLSDNRPGIKCLRTECRDETGKALDEMLEAAAADNLGIYQHIWLDRGAAAAVRARGTPPSRTAGTEHWCAGPGRQSVEGRAVTRFHRVPNADIFG